MLLLAILFQKTYIGFRFVLGIKSYMTTVPIDTHTHWLNAELHTGEKNHYPRAKKPYGCILPPATQKWDTLKAKKRKVPQKGAARQVEPTTEQSG